jgi:hypothetical protein
MTALITTAQRQVLKDLVKLIQHLPDALPAGQVDEDNPFANVGPEEGGAFDNLHRGQLVEKPEEVARVIKFIDDSVSTGAFSTASKIIRVLAQDVFPLLKALLPIP